jgi:predicted double-glycine peptidase
MNVQGKINKLLLALRMKGRIIKKDTQQWYAEDSGKVITKYILYEEHPKKDGEVFYSKIQMLKYLAEKYKKVGEVT